MCSKLDRAMVNQHLINSEFEGIAEFIAPGCISDHTLTIVSCFEMKMAKHKPFKFF